MHLLERADILDQLNALLVEARRGTGSLACLSGEAGVGKTAIARHFADNAGPTVRVLWGACEDLSTPEPLGPINELIGSSDIHVERAETRIVFFTAMLEQITSRPSLVVIDDVHWADDATLDFIRFAGRRIAGKPLLVLITSRDDTLDAEMRLRRALVNVPAAACAQLKVVPLSKDATMRLTRGSGQDAETLYALTNGNPFLVTEALRSRGGVSDSVRQALLWRADKLSTSGRMALEAASIFPRRVEHWLLEAMCPQSSIGIKECVDHGLLIVHSPFFAFRHEIARQTIEHSLLPNVRMGLNQNAWRLLQSRQPDAVARIVHHAIEAGDADATIALAPLAAAEASEAGAHRQAATQYAAALQHARLLTPARRAELYELAAFELQLIGQLTDALGHFRAAHALHQASNDTRRAGDVLRWISRLSYNLGDSAAANEYGHQAVSVLRPLGPGPELAMAYANIALITALRDDSAEAIELAEQTIELANTLAREDVLADAFGTLGLAKQWSDLQAARAHFKDALELALKLKRPELVARMYSNASCIEFNARQHAAAHKLLERGISYCQERDLDSWWAYMRGWLAELLVREGEWESARLIAREVVNMPMTARVLRFPATAALARLRLRQGDEGYDALEPDLTFEDEPQRLLVYAPILGERTWLRESDPVQTINILQSALQTATAIGNPWAAGEAAYWIKKLGGLGDASGPAQPYALQFEGRWRSAAAAWADINATFEQALALLEGDDEARRQGLFILDSLGADATAKRFRDELRVSGARGLPRGPRRSTRANPAGLTHRELQVLKLIDKGHSNSAIAAALNVSIKTVDHHVSAILSKLRVTSRGEAVAKARALGAIGH